MAGERTASKLLLLNLDDEQIKKPERKGRSEKLIDERNDFFIHRFAYYQMHTTHRYDEILRRLKQELFLAEFTLGKMVVQYASDIARLKKSKPKLSYFRKKYDWLVW